MRGAGIWCLPGARAHDDETADRISQVLSAHGGHFINYYTNWTARLLVP